MLYKVKAPSITAVVREPGTPKVSIGINEPQADALFAASGAAIPRKSPSPNFILLPAIAAVSFVGVYAIHSTMFDLILMVALGVFGYILRKLNFPLSALILGFVLGELMESSLRRALSISQGELSILFDGYITKTLWILPLIRWLRSRQQVNS